VVLSAASQPYAKAVVALGAAPMRLYLRHILPNVASALIVQVTLNFPQIILLETSLSFLGLGIQPPWADWGGMVRDNAQAISFGGIAPLIPAAAIAILTIGVNLVVDWILSVHAARRA
jgi:peptide/nickel transport system permease protein